jgi:PAS domain S-box-containing protein
MLRKSQFGLRGKVTLGLALILIISLLITSLSSYLQSKQVAERKVIELEKSKLDVLNHVILGSLQSHQNTLLSLRDIPAFQAILRAQSNKGIDPDSGSSLAVWKNRLKAIFSAFIANNTEYLQIRYIGLNGKEIVRVQINEFNEIEVVSDNLLQNKADELYVIKTLEMPSEQVYFSNVSLNREHGVVQVPYQPVLRLAAPVLTDDNQVKGIIVINLATEKLFHDIKLINQGTSQFMVDENGNYILHTLVEKTFAKDKGLDHNFHKDYPQLASFSHKNDNLMRSFNNSAEILGFEKIYFSPFDKTRYWLIVQRVPESVVFADIRTVLNQILFVGLIIGVLSLILIVCFVSRRILAPVLNLAAAAERLQDGDLTVRLDALSVHDEFRTLYKTINTFTIKQQEFTVKLQQEIESQTHKLSAIIENIVDGIITIDNKGNIKTFNQAARKMFGYQNNEVMGCSIGMLVPKPSCDSQDSNFSRNLAQMIEKSMGVGTEIVGLRKDGSEFPLDLAVSEVKMDNAVHFIGITRDVTERKRIELMQKEFISTVSHELRTPLTSISGSLGLILGGATGELPEKARALITIANNNSERLILLINDILDIEKISAGKMQFNFSVISLTPLIKQSLDENKGYGAKLNVSFKLVSAPEKALTVRVDEKRLLQGMSNLLSNAAKYSPTGEQVDIKIEQIGDSVRVSVHDKGKGIPEAFRSKIFNRFSQADSSDTRQKGGTGLGLNITKAIILKHKGSIGYDSVEGKGTTFYIDLPLYIKHDEKEVMVVQQKEHNDKPLILIIEDDRDVSKLLSIMLENENYQLDHAFNYEEAIEKISANKYDVITLDLMIPGGNGINIVRELRNNEATMTLPVIVVSAIADKIQNEVACDAFEMVDWLEKPIDNNRLVNAINTSLAANSTKGGNILHIEDDPDITAIVASLLDNEFNVINANTLTQAKKLVSNNHFDLVLLDIGLPDGSGLDILPLLRGEDHQTPVVIFSAQDVPEETASEVLMTLVKSKTNNEYFLRQIKQAINRKH